MANKWMKLVMKTKKAHPKLSLGQAMKLAKKQYKKGGAEEPEEKVEIEEKAEVEEAYPMSTPEEGARRKRKTRRGGSKLSPAPVGGRRRTTKGARRTRKH